MVLEVIAKNLRDILKINKTKADRIEFCRCLTEGGLSANRWVIKIAVKISKVPINVMLRPSSESFNYSEKDFNRMLKDAAFLEKTKVNGVVFGILNDNNEIDVARMQEIISKIPSKQKVFHKAFDEVKDFNKSLDVLKELKIDAVLTSAGSDINNNLAILKQLKDKKKLIIIGGGGINFNNIKNVSLVVDEIHVGTTVRKNSSWSGTIDVNKVNQLKGII